MELDPIQEPTIPAGLADAIRSFSLHREATHCGNTFRVSPFDLYAECPHCGARIKVRGLCAGADLEDVFDAVFEWMGQPGASDLVRRRQQEIESDRDE